MVWGYLREFVFTGGAGGRDELRFAEHVLQAGTPGSTCHISSHNLC